MLPLGKNGDLLLATKLTLGAQKSNKCEKEAVERRNDKQDSWCPSESAASFSALSDTPAKSYAPELGRPKGEYRVSYSIHWCDSFHSIKYLDICYLA